MPCSVLSRIGKNEPRKVMKTMLSSFVGHSMIDIGTQAIAGIGRSTSVTGNTNSRSQRNRPITSPSGTATTVASEKPMKMRRQLSIDMHVELRIVQRAHEAVRAPARARARW